ncbi:hypothetical protein KKC13_05915 [bacterium]|nr:hypothetical protein [bacterium]MBU1957856.1 hypothetical protein [bacterium]
MRFLLITFFFSFSFLQAQTDEPVIKHKLNCNMTIQYIKKPKKVQSIKDLLSEGIFYGRIRFNNFLFDKGVVGENYYIAGLGGSLIYKSAYLNGFSATTGAYTSQNIGHMDSSLVDDYRAGKDVLNRYNVATSNEYGLNSLALAYGEYKTRKEQIKIGRFPLETLLLKTNDTKMIPNTFEGIYFRTRSFPKTTIQSAYITKQKLRDHNQFHHVLAYGDDSSDPYSKWTQNDDAGMHRGLTISKLADRNIKDRLFVLDAINSSMDDITFKASYIMAPDLLSSLILESRYMVEFDELRVMPSIRYMQQFDNGAGSIGGANLKNNTIAYKDPESLNAALIAGRIDFLKGASTLRLGYSKVENQGDIVAPWRGFPTAGYSRAIGQTNWYANTQTYMLRADYDFSKAEILKGLRGVVRYAVNDFDDNKPGVQADSNVLSFDIVKRYESMPTLHTKIRTAFINGDNQTIAEDNSKKTDPSYNEIRLEINYLF